MSPVALAEPVRSEREANEVELLSGVEALVRLPIEQHLLDLRAGLRTATLISGYPGSPLGTLDLALERNAARLAEHGINHEPGVNEELAAAALWGTQQTMLMREELDGVLGMWYGKGPGVDRCGDVFKHANSMGSARNGGVLVVTGDDPSAKSSTLPNDTRYTLMDAGFPILVAASVPDVIRLGLHGFALSRFSGLWTGLRIQTDIADGFASTVVDSLIPRPVLPEVIVDGRSWKHVQIPKVDNTVSVRQEEEIFNGRMEAAREYCRANSLNEISHACSRAWLGIAAVGKAHADTVQALRSLGLGDRELEAAGIRIMKVAMPFPLEPTAIHSFAAGLEQILVVEEKRPLLEILIKDVLYTSPSRPAVIGKRDERGAPLVPLDGSLTPERMIRVLADRLSGRVAGLRLPSSPPASVGRPIALASRPAARPQRLPAYCSGCPHNKSTAGPAGAVIGGGVGCHSIVYLEERHADNVVLPLTPMGAEGVPWIGIAPFAKAPHIFQNLGDGTLNHSGTLAIRACIAAGADITFKILYNSAIAMTGGQPVAGEVAVPDLTRELEAMGVGRILVLSDDPSRYGRRPRFARNAKVWDRDRIADAEALLAKAKGVTAIVYDERCKAEARRLWKRGELERPSTRVMINESVCEGCGDCQVKSNCLSVIPVDTPLGRKTQIHQPSCNNDLTCVKGDCPSFVTVDVAGLKPRAAAAMPEPPEHLPDPTLNVPEDHIAAYMVGIGGTGVVTANRVLATAAVRDGFTVSGLDQTGLSQKAGAVSSHLRASRGERPPSNTVAEGACTVYLAFDPLAGSEQRHLSRIESGTTHAVVSSSLAPTISIITHAYEPMPDVEEYRGAIEALAGQTITHHAESLSETLFADHMPANILLIGVAYQAGTLPLRAESIEATLASGRGAKTNIAAFRWGRALVAAPDLVEAVVATRQSPQERLREPSENANRIGARLLAEAELPPAVAAVADWRARDLVDYQSEALAARYVGDLARVARAEQARAPGETALGEAVAHHLYKLLAYKDEYEVARLHLDPRFGAAVRSEFPGAAMRFQLHPPLLRGLGMQRKIAIPERVGSPLFRALRRMRKVRGTWADPFGRAEVRRIERELPDEMLAAVEDALTRSHGEALAVAEAVDEIRGYEDIKLAGVARFRKRVERLRDEGAAGPSPVALQTVEP